MSSSSTEAGRFRTKFTYAFGALGALLFGYDTGIVAAAILFINKDFNLSSFLSGLVVSILLIGAMIGAATGGNIADALGRKKTVLIAGLVFVVGALGSGLAPSADVLIISRFVLGLGVGVASVTVPVYLAEIAPTHVRGRISSLNNLLIDGGQFVAFIVGAILAQYGAWRWMLGLAVIPSLLMILGVLFMTETPRWLVRQHREDEAREVMRLNRDEETLEKELQGIKEAEGREEGGLRELLAPWLRPMLIVGVGLAILQQIMGINTIVYYAPTTLTHVGFGATGASVASISVGALAVISILVAQRYYDRVGRKPLLLGGAIGTFVSLAILAVVSLLTPIPTSIGPVGIITLVCMVLYIFFFQGTWGTLVWVMLGEIFPLKIRGAAMGLATLVLWAANFVVALTFPILLGAFGVGWLFLIYAFICLCAFFFAWFVVPETKGRSLEEIEADLLHGHKAGQEA